MPISLLSWNIWFGSQAFSKRCEAIVNACETLNPDVICLQEVTPEFCHHLLRILPTSPWLRTYDSSDSNFIGKSVEPYGVMILCKKELNPSFTFHPLVTTMCRQLLVADIPNIFSVGEINSGVTHPTLKIGTVHLESLYYHSVREQQLEVCAAVLAAHPSILCGDFNFCSYRQVSKFYLELSFVNIVF